jgi:ABC-2 type transport system ATP-binding protein
MAFDSIAIQVEDLTKKFMDFTAVNRVSFQVHRGEIFGFLGPNGSGKTTTIRMMLGLLPPTSGAVEVLGVDMSDQPERIRPQVGYMSQRFTLYNDLTVLQNLQFYGRAYGLKETRLHERIHYALEMSSLVGREHTRTKDLSGGWRQRLALGAAILHQPELIFLDEPTAGVDPVSRRAFWDLLYHLISVGVTVFVTTHYMDEAEHCHRLAFIQRGKLIAIGTPGELKEQVLPGILVELAPEDPSRVLQVLKSWHEQNNLPPVEITLYGALIHLYISEESGWTVKHLQHAVQKICDQHRVDAGTMSVIDPSLEDVFIASMRQPDVSIAV